MATKVGVENLENRHNEALGTVQLRHQVTNDVILVPAPSDDPNDPLNWYVRFALLLPSSQHHHVK